jgi:hypothetical protein
LERSKSKIDESKSWWGTRIWVCGFRCFVYGLEHFCCFVHGFEHHPVQCSQCSSQDGIKEKNVDGIKEQSTVIRRV